MSQIKLIIFDLSGVCFNLEEPIYLENFIKQHGLDSRRESFLSRYDELLKPTELGESSGADLWKILSREYNFKQSPAFIIKDMMDLKVPNVEVLEIAERLKKKYTVVYLTNYNHDYWDEILRRFNFTKWFNWGVVSYQIGCRKPAKSGFEYILNKAKVKAEQAVFIDDNKDNLTEPTKLGLRAIQFTGKKELVKSLAVMGIKIF